MGFDGVAPILRSDGVIYVLERALAQCFVDRSDADIALAG